MMHALAQANGFVVVPETRAELAAGDVAQILLFKE
jgi:molybdopterin biosynthesis enzyme